MKCVEWCKNWEQLYMSRGMHCFNCWRRNGYPFRAQPSKACKNYDLMTREEKQGLCKKKAREAVNSLCMVKEKWL